MIKHSTFAKKLEKDHRKDKTKKGESDPKKDRKDQYYWGLTTDKNQDVVAYFVESRDSGGDGGSEEIPWLDGARVEGLRVLEDPFINGGVVPGQHIVGYTEAGPFICATKRGLWGSLFIGAWDVKKDECEIKILGLEVKDTSYFGKNGLLTRKKQRTRKDSNMKLVLTIRPESKTP